jgi:hypothetical protein
LPAYPPSCAVTTIVGKYDRVSSQLTQGFIPLESTLSIALSKVLETEADLRTVYKQPTSGAVSKTLRKIDPHYWIALPAPWQHRGSAKSHRNRGASQ